VIKNISTRKLRANLSRVLKNVDERLDRYVILRRGKPEAILMCIDDYEEWLETLEIMGSKGSMDDIRQAKKELVEGKSHSFDEVFGRPKKKKKR